MEDFKNRKLIIATMHGKEKFIGPILEKNLGVEIITPKEFNSDKFGTFTNEIKRYGNQLDAARAKLNQAMNEYNIDLGVASEGSFGGHPSMPFVQSNLELILFIDKKNKYEILGHHRTLETNMSGQYVHNSKEAVDFSKKIGFPDHGIILKVNTNNLSEIYKDIDNENDLIKKINKALSANSKIFIETDMRAHKNPTRMKAIEYATIDLIKNIKSLCPKCNTPGFAITDTEKGLKCELCKNETMLPKNKISKCQKCRYMEKNTAEYGSVANPMYCQYCNP